MKRSFVLALGLIILASPAFAQSLPSSKAAVQLSVNALIQPTGNQAWTPVLETSLKVAEQKDLMIGVSLETGLMTNTLVRSKGGVSDTSTAQANVEVQVLVDGVAAQPGTVTFDKRYQELMATFNGICGDLNGDGIVNFDECETPEEVQLILDTLAAHHFNFVLDDLGAGVHTVVVQARVSTSTTTQAGLATATGAIGKGSLTVEEVRLVKGVEITK